MASEGFHEPIDRLRPETLDVHRAITSLMEELEAVDWYNQRVDAVGDAELGAVLAHNRDEEKEHASMLLEWLRRRDPVLDRHLRTYLFTEGSILDLEHAAEHGDDDAAPGDSSGGSGGGRGGAGAGGIEVGSLRRTDLPSQRPLPD